VLAAPPIFTMGGIGRLVGEHLHWPRRYKVEALAHFVYPGPERHCHWKMRGRLAGALEALGWAADPPDFEVHPEEVPEGTQFPEGAVRRVEVNAYERNTAARRLCLAHYGNSCVACGINLKAAYGLEEDFIHVHHIRMLAKISKEYRVDPVKDLRPVCPNCHSIIHLNKPAFSIDEVKAMLTAQRESKEVPRQPWLDPSELREARLRQRVVRWSDMTPDKQTARKVRVVPHPPKPLRLAKGKTR